MLRKIFCVVAAMLITVVTLFLFVDRTPVSVSEPEAPTLHSGAPAPFIDDQDIFAIWGSAR
jgi:hypothetical protein